MKAGRGTIHCAPTKNIKDVWAYRNMPIKMKELVVAYCIRPHKPIIKLINILSAKEKVIYGKVF